MFPDNEQNNLHIIDQEANGSPSTIIVVPIAENRAHLNFTEVLENQTTKISTMGEIIFPGDSGLLPGVVLPPSNNAISQSASVDFTLGGENIITATASSYLVIKTLGEVEEIESPQSQTIAISMKPQAKLIFNFIDANIYNELSNNKEISVPSYSDISHCKNINHYDTAYVNNFSAYLTYKPRHTLSNSCETEKTITVEQILYLKHLPKFLSKNFTTEYSRKPELNQMQPLKIYNEIDKELLENFISSNPAFAGMSYDEESVKSYISYNILKVYGVSNNTLGIHVYAADKASEFGGLPTETLGEIFYPHDFN